MATSVLYYVRRLAAQWIDAIVVSLMGVGVFFHTPYSPVLRDEHQWQLTLSPCFPSQYGLWVASKGAGWAGGADLRISLRRKRRSRCGGGERRMARRRGSPTGSMRAGG